MFLSKPRRISKTALIAICFCVLFFGGMLYLIGSALHLQTTYRNFIYALSDSTVYCYENNCLRAELEGDTVRVTGENAYAVYFLFTKKPGKPRVVAPQEDPHLILDYGDGATLECWSYKMEGSARRTYGIFWRFTSAEGKVFLFDTDDLSLSQIKSRVSLKKNAPW